MLIRLPSRGRGETLPLALIVLFMSQDAPDQDDLIPEEHFDDETILVSADIDYDDRRSAGSFVSFSRFGRVKLQSRR
jgi:hypothetical protein